MIIKVECRNTQGNLLTFNLDEDDSGYVVRDIDGLDPVNATLVSSSFAGLDGEQYQASKREKRNIVIKLDLEPDAATTSVRKLRKRLYGFFMPKSPIALRFFLDEEDDNLTVDIAGRVESCGVPLFTAEPQVDISILCFDPDFVDPEGVEFAGSTTATETETAIGYNGEVAAGFLLTLNVDRSLSEFSLYHRTADDQLRQLDFAGALVSGDVLKISTVTGNKFATLNHLGTETSALDNVSPQSIWSEFTPGENYIRLYAEGTPIPFTIEYVTRYGGL